MVHLEMLLVILKVMNSLVGTSSRTTSPVILAKIDESWAFVLAFVHSLFHTPKRRHPNPELAD